MIYCSVKFKNEGYYTITPPVCLCGMHRDCFAFTFMMTCVQEKA